MICPQKKKLIRREKKREKHHVKRKKDWTDGHNLIIFDLTIIT